MPTGATATFAYSWTVDGVDAGNNTRIVPASSTIKHQIWQVSVLATSGGQTFGPATASIEILNSAPTNAVFITPAPACDNDPTLTANVITGDADGDTVAVTYQWGVDADDDDPDAGLVFVATTPTLGSSFYTLNDIVGVAVGSNDGEVDGVVSTFFTTILDSTNILNFCTIFVPPAPLIGIAPLPGPPASVAVHGSSASALPAALAALRARVLETSGASDAAEGEPASDEPATGDPALPGSLISIGEGNVCSVAIDGALQCSGDERFGLTEPPAGAYLQVEVAGDVACAIRADDLAVTCWGEPPAGSAVLSAPDGPFVEIDLGSDAACGLRQSGELACWGSDALGQAVPEGRFVALDVHDAYACAIREDDLVLCWGE